MQNDRISQAADLLGLSIDTNLSEKTIKQRYRNIINHLHPDKWATENNPDISKKVSDLVIQMTDARNILLNILSEANHES